MSAAPTNPASGTLTPALGTVTVTIASPAVFTKTAHGLAAGDKVQLTTTGALPTGLTPGTTYFVIAAGLTANNFEVSTTAGGAAVNTTGTQSGVHTLIAEQFVWRSSAACVVEFEADPSALAAFDIVEFRIYKQVLTGGTPRVYQAPRAIGAQAVDDMLLASIPCSTALSDAGALAASIKQITGTARAIPWAITQF